MTSAEVVEPVPEVVVEDAAPKMAAKKERVKRPEKPDRQELDGQVQKLQAQIDQCQARINEIKVTIEQRKDQRKNVSSGGSQARARLQELRQDFRQNVDAKNALRAALAQSDAARDKLREEAKAMRGKLSFVKVEQIDDEIAKLEHKIAHTTIAIEEERRTVEQIKQLRKSRDMVKVYNDRLERLHDDDEHRRAIMDQIKSKDTELNQNKLAEGQQRQALEAIRAKEDEQVADLPSLINERNEAYEIVREAREALRQLRADFKEKEDVFWKQERQWRAQAREEKQKQWEAGQAERKERAERRKQWELENAPPPFDKEVMAAEMLLGYLAQFEPQAAPAPAPEAPAAPLLRDDLTEISGKMTDEEDKYNLGGGGGGKKGKKGKKSAKKEEKEETLSFSLDALGSFAALKIKPPLNKAEALTTIPELKAKMEHFLEKRKEKLEKMANGIEEKEEQEGEEGSSADGVKVTLKVTKNKIVVRIQ